MYPLRSRTAAILFAAAAAAVMSPAAFAILAFPGAEGFGANATGGRGGDVYHVTTLANDPNHLIPGSLYYGLYEKNVPAGGRTIVFDVGGTIDLGGTSLDIKNIKNVTIAGQTAPSPITIINNTTQVTSSSGKETGNIIVQYLTFRKGAGGGDDAFHIQGSGNTHDIMVDHVSGSWSEDEVISSTQNGTNVTVQNSIMSEALTSSHAYGSLVRPQINASVSFNRNLYSNQKSRNPRPGTYDGMTLNLEFQNNVIYNWSDRAGYIAGADGNTQHLNMNYVGNYLIAGPVAVNNSSNPIRRDTAFIEELSSSAGSLLDLHIFQQNNKIDNNSNTIRDGVDTGWGMFRTLQTNGTYTAYTESEKSATPFAFPGYATADSADVAYAKVIASVGAFPYARSTTDLRLINDVLNYTGFAPITAPDSAEWTAISTGAGTPTATRAANWDTDRDGMPNAWETLRGFNPNSADNNVYFPDGYTRLEKYLHSLTAIAAWNTDASTTWSNYLNWRGTRPESADATAVFGPVISAPRTVTLDAPFTTGALAFSSAQSYTLAGAALTFQVPAGRATIDVLQGSHKISAPITFASPAALSIAAGASLDTTNNILLLTNADGTSPVATIRQYLHNHQLISSTASADSLHALGYRLNPDNTVTVQPALIGDANLDGTLNADDYAILDRAFARNTSNALWMDGDFNYDGAITAADYLLIDTTNCQLQGLSPEFLSLRESQFGPDYVSQLLISIPEPTLLSLLLAPVPFSRRRR